MYLIGQRSVIDGGIKRTSSKLRNSVARFFKRYYFQLSTYALQPSRLIVRSGLDVQTFATRRLHACHHARAPSGGRWNCGREMSGNFAYNAEFHVTFRDLLHAVKLRHGTDGFTSPPKEGVLRTLSP